MTNEIKELIDNIKKIIEENRKNDFNHIILQSTSMEQLLDYITNLQEEKKRLLESADCLSKGYSELEQRIDKAIYWIDEYCIKLCDEADVISELRVVKDILRGDE